LKIKGNKAERAQMRKAMQNPKTTSEERAKIKLRIGESTAFQVNKLRLKNPAKAEAIHAGLGKMGYSMEQFGFKPFGATAKITVSTPKPYASFEKPLGSSAVAGGGGGKDPIGTSSGGGGGKDPLGSSPGGQYGSSPISSSGDQPSQGAGKSHGMTQAEEASLIGYTGNHYVSLNKGLRAGMLTDNQYSHIANINRALDKLPVHVGTVSRGRHDNAAHLYQVGMIIEERGFTSTTANVGEKTAFGTGTRYYIESKSGRSIKQFSQHKNENEVLFRSGTRFKVTEVKGNVVRMTEVGRF
jgi:hypothetical protein